MNKKLVIRINRVIGQAQGVKNMLESNRDCIEILQQIIAVRAGLSSLGRELVRTESESCAMEKNTERLRRVIDLVVKM